MTFALNPSTSQTQALFESAAISQNGTDSTNSSKTSSSGSGISTGAKVAIGVVIPVAIIALLIGVFFFFRRRKTNQKTHPEETLQLQQQQTSLAPPEFYGGRDFKGSATTGSEYAPETSEVHGESTPSELPNYDDRTHEMPEHRFSHRSFSEMDTMSPMSPTGDQKLR
jgi:hypothetical protein